MFQVIAASLPFVLLSPLAAAQGLLPREPLRVDQVTAAEPQVRPEVAGQRRLIVKFVDSALVRADIDGALDSLSGESLASVQALATTLGTELRFRALLSTSAADLTALEQRAAARSGRAQPDLAGMLIVELGSVHSQELERVGQALNDLAITEWAWIESLDNAPPGDIAPTTPNLEAQQSWRGPNPGIDVDYAWSVGARGQNVRLSDCEYGWDPDHEDMNDVSLNLEPGQTISGFVFSNGWDDHGTAALGEVAAQDNGYGCSGIAPLADFYTFPENSVEEGSRRLSAITNAIAGSSEGDVVLLEMQASGAGGGYGPAELSSAVWTVCKAGSDAGVIIVGAAGNGNQNLDSSAYNTYNSWGDSGAIIVGAGSSNSSHSKLSFSTYGARVNVQGWGGSVFTLGYGGFNVYGGDDHQSYTGSFNGTSSASPFVAGSCVAIQSFLKAQGSQILSPAGMRDLLVSTGVAQGSGGHIGPFPDLRAAIENVDPCPAPQNYCTTSPNSAGSGSLITWNGSTSLSANDAKVSVLGAPANVFGLFFFGAGETATPLGNGQLCVAAGSSGTFRMPPAALTGSVGYIERNVEFDQAPLNSGAGQAVAGQTRRWQFWYRDSAAGGAGFNFSDALRVTYCP
ncbi:MAG: hypothetical protein ACI8X5_000608 [Planctomycetota bacterium]|jgi:hypothetical protein